MHQRCTSKPDRGVITPLIRLAMTHCSHVDSPYTTLRGHLLPFPLKHMDLSIANKAPL